MQTSAAEETRNRGEGRVQEVCGAFPWRFRQVQSRHARSKTRTGIADREYRSLAGGRERISAIHHPQSMLQYTLYVTMSGTKMKRSYEAGPSDPQGLDIYGINLPLGRT